ncbi:transcription termination factor MTERF8, chloroplastic-like [Rutidosis leptorrhynchoides]|uniref:transcription termination factor MTERF8, chloroplastic-like n=1 Tax=Rutidosis leptorrhynchoides TaxID=125765 RepID=UPI003A9A0AC2
MVTLFNRYLHTVSSSPSKSAILTYLTESLGFPKPRALLFFNKYSSTETNPQSVITFLKSFGFTNSDIQTWVTQSPPILFSNIDRTLKPNLQYFQGLGLNGLELSKFISKNPSYLSDKFQERLKPCIDIVKRSMLYDDNNDKDENLIRLLRRCNWILVKDPVTRVASNIKYLEQCGIVGAQLTTIISRQPRLLIMGEFELKELVAKVVDKGFSTDSRMFVHALYTISCLSAETFEKKVELFQSFGFSEDELLAMFRRAPGLIRASESKLRVGIDFFLNEVKFKKEAIVCRPTCLMLSLDERVIPRYNVLNLMMSKKILKKRPKFSNVIWLPENEFLDKYIFKNGDHEDELLLAYKGGGLIVAKE